MIKYLGSKRRLIPVLAELATRSGASTALDLFTGTTRVAQALKLIGQTVTAVDTARYSEVFARTWIETDARKVDFARLDAAIGALNVLKARPGYFTEVFCEQARFFQPHNGARVDAIRDAIAADFANDPLEPILLTALLLAADRVDSTTGVQMAYVKSWAKRSYNELHLVRPELIAGPGHAVRGDATALTPTLGRFDLAYLDPPYNQHRYFANYHIWETLVAWDAPEHYGVACKRIDTRDDATKSSFNRRREMPIALADTISNVDAGTLIVSYNDESWVELDELRTMCAANGRHERVSVLGFESPRYVGARIGIHNPQGEKVGRVSHTRNLEYVVVAGDSNRVTHMIEPFRRHLIDTE